MPTPASDPAAPDKGELHERAAARREHQRRREIGGVRYFQPISEEQRRFLSFTKTGALAIGGNRAGKTECGAAEATWRLLGDHPYKEVHRAPVKLWACSQDLPGTPDKPHTQSEKLKKLIPRDALRGGCWEKAYSPSGFTVTLANGSVVAFKSYDQGPLKFESQAIHGAWFDEEPANKSIWTSTLMRLTDFDGQWWMTVTPILSLEGKGWIEELWDNRLKPESAYEWFQLLTTDNSTLPSHKVAELLGSLSDEERKVRSCGAFARVGGRILNELDPAVHYGPDFLPPHDWQWYLVIDWGYANATAHLWAAVRPGDGHVFLFAEHYEAHQPPAYHMAVAHAMYEAFGRPHNLIVLGDPAGFYPHNASNAVETPADVDEYRKAARLLKADWFQPRKAVNGDPLAYRVKRYLACERVTVGASLSWWKWEADRWTRKRERAGLVATEQHLPEKPKDKDNHLMACTRYLFNALPDPTPAASSKLPRTWEDLAAEALRHHIGEKELGEVGPLGSEA